MTEIVRWKVDAIPESPFGVSQRLADTAPGLSSKALGRALRLPAGSRIRRRVITESLRVGLAAAGSHDFEKLLPFYDPAVVYDLTGSRIFTLGDTTASYHGHDGIRVILAEMAQSMAMAHQLEEIADAGGPYFAALTMVRSVANFSRIEFSDEVSQVYDARGGTIRHQWTLDGWDAGIEKLAEIASS